MLVAWRETVKGSSFDAMPAPSSATSIRRLPAHGGPVCCATWSPNGARLASTSDDGVVRQLDDALVLVGDLELAAIAGLELADHLEDLMVVAVDAGDGVVRFGFCGFLLDA